jgi:hypothetical protein
MTLIAIIIFTILTLFAIFHIIWANGIFWPAKDEQALVKMVIGEPNMRKIYSSKLTYSVAIAFIIAAIFALWGGNVIALPLPLWIRELGVFLLAFIFGTRGLATYMIAKQLGEKTQPFKMLDRTIYAPISIIIAIGFIYMLVKG